MKCVVWDLDETLVSGAGLRPGAVEMLARIESLGVVNAVASRNDSGALDRYPDLGRAFVAAHVGPAPKPVSIARIAEQLAIGLDSMAFVDDDAFERAQVRFALPEVLVLTPDELPAAVASWLPATTDEGRRRADMYRDAARRDGAARAFRGSRDEFLRSCAMRLGVGPARHEDVSRLVELSERTNRMNSTGRRFARCDLEHAACAALSDRFGDYGLVAGAVVRDGVVELLMASCRAEGRGVPAALVAWLVERGARVVELVPTDRNVGMRVLLRACGFVPEHDATRWRFARALSPAPQWLTMEERT